MPTDTPLSDDLPDPEEASSTSLIRQYLVRYREWLIDFPEGTFADFLEQHQLAAPISELLQRALTQYESAVEATMDPGSVAEDHMRTVSYQAAGNHAHRIINGRYRLLEEIGSGGMGTVWLAEQLEPVQRRVALKLIKSEFITRDELARFEAERQALAMMDHPNIAHIFDAGTTEAGTPFFVMEYVPGWRITEYCDRHNLSIRERLELFIPVCRAVQHAHQKGIIHRDLKPGNILVAHVEGKPVPKVIDFGLAKAIDHTRRLTDKTLFTGAGHVVGTLQYMSPEQASIDSTDIDTRSDIYSLGIILYELLIGIPPLDHATIKRHAYLKVLELIREGDTPRPSHRLRAMGQAASGISQHRQIAPGRLQSILRGELDWIVMKTLEKDRQRRYDTAAALADDIHRFLFNEPVLARPRSRYYGFSKFVRRHRTGVIATAVIILMGFIGVLGVFAAWRTSLRNELLAKESAQQAIAFANQLAEAQEQSYQIIQEMTDQVMTDLKGFEPGNIHFIEQNPPKPDPLTRSRNSLGALLAMMGQHLMYRGADPSEAGSWFVKAIEQFHKLDSDGQLEQRSIINYLTALMNAALFKMRAGETATAVQYSDRHLEMLHRLKTLVTEEDRDTLLVWEATLLLNRGLMEQSLLNWNRAIDILQPLSDSVPTRDVTLARLLHNRATCLPAEDAEHDLLQAIELMEKHACFSDLMNTYDYMATIQDKLNNNDTARFYSAKALELTKLPAFNPDSDDLAYASQAFYNAGVAHQEADEVDAAMEQYNQAMEIERVLVARDPHRRHAPLYFQLFWNRAEVLVSQGQFEAAEQDFREAISAVYSSGEPQYERNLHYLEISLAMCRAVSDPVSAAKNLDLLESPAAGKGEAMVRLANIYALAAAAETDEAERTKWISRGVSLLKSAWSENLLPPEYIEQINSDPDLEILRKDQLLPF